MNPLHVLATEYAEIMWNLHEITMKFTLNHHKTPKNIKFYEISVNSQSSHGFVSLFRVNSNRAAPQADGHVPGIARAARDGTLGPWWNHGDSWGKIIGFNTQKNSYVAVCQNLVPLVNIKIAGKWMFIPLKIVLIGIDPYPCKKRVLSWIHWHIRRKWWVTVIHC